MKKYLFLAISILSIFFVTDRVEALTFDFNGVETEVTKENYIYYIYQNYTSYFENYEYFVVTEDFTKYNRIIFYFFDYLNKYSVYSSSIEISTTTDYKPITRLIFDTSYTFKSSNEATFLTFPGGNADIITYSNLTFSASNNSSIVFNANITKDDLKNIGPPNIYTITYYINNEVYKTIEVEEGTSHELLSYEYNENTHNFSGWQYDETLDFTNITSDITINATLEEKVVIPVYMEFPINKTEFYVLLVEVGVLIMMLFLKWCFPFKGGSDLR